MNHISGKKNVTLKDALKIIATLLVFLSVIILASASWVEAAINKEINYQGKLTDTSGTAVSNGTYNMEFKLYTVASGGSPIWTETRTSGDKVQVTSGLFSLLLGSVNSLSGIDFNQPLYLGVNIGGTSTPGWDGEMTPRKKLGSVPSAFVAETLNGLFASQFFRSDVINSTSSAVTFMKVEQAGAGAIAQFIGSGSSTVMAILSGGSVGIGTSSPTSKLTVDGNALIHGNLSSTGTITNGVSSLNSDGTAVFSSGNILFALNGSASFSDGNALISNAGHFSAGGGSAAEPSFTFTGSASSGMYFDGTALGISYNGQEVLKVDEFSRTSLNSSDGQVLAINDDSAGNVGIGTTTPYVKFTVQGDFGLSGGLFDNVGSSGTGGQVLQSTGSGMRWISTSSLGISGGGSGNSAFTIGNGVIYNATSTNLVGIGTSSPSTTLFIQGKGGTNPFAVASSSGVHMLTLLQNGSLGIGTSSPNAALSIVGQANTSVIAAYGSNSTAGNVGGGFIFVGGRGADSPGMSNAATAGGGMAITLGRGGDGGYVHFPGGQGGSFVLTAGQGGNGGDGDPGANGGDVTLQGGAAGASAAGGRIGYILLNPTGGNVGIGTSTPAFRLDVNGAARVSSALYVGTSTDLSSKLFVDFSTSTSGYTDNVYAIRSRVSNNVGGGPTYAGHFQAVNGGGALENGAGLYGIFAEAGSVGEFGSSYGVYAQAAVGDGPSTGVFGQGGSYGIYGSSSASVAVFGTGRTALQGSSNNASGYGLNVSQANASGYAIYALGGKNYFQNNVGIGTTSPLAKLDIFGAGGASPFRISSSTNSSMFEINQAGAMLLNNNAGSLGYVLMSNGLTGVPTWVATSSLGMLGGGGGSSPNYLILGSGFVATATTTDAFRSAYFMATSTAATSTFAGRLAVGSQIASTTLHITGDAHITATTSAGVLNATNFWDNRRFTTLNDLYETRGYGRFTLGDYYLATSTTDLSASIATGISGATYNPNSNTVFMVNNNTFSIYEFSLNGTLLRTIALTNFPDPEAMSWMYDDMFVIGDENLSTLTMLRIASTTTALNRTAATSTNIDISATISSGTNTGIEGVAYDSDRDVFYVIKEKTSSAIYKVTRAGTASTLFTLSTLLTAAGGMTDASDVYFDRNSQNLFISSDEGGSDRIIQTDLQGNLISQLLAPTGFGQVEGIGFTPDGETMFVTGENDTYARYEFFRNNNLLALVGGATANAGRVGIGSTSPIATLSIAGSGGTNPFVIASSSGSQLLTLTQAGNLGIGSTSPSATLTVAGSLALSGGLYTGNNATGTFGMVLQTTGTSTQWVATSSLGIGGGSGSPNGTSGTLQFNNAGNFGGDDNLFWDDTNDRLGIGTSSPAEKLHVAGSILIGARNDSAGAWTKRTHTTAGTITSGGTASIGTTTAMAVFNGSLYAGTSKANGAEVYRYDGSNSWTRVSSTTPGAIGTSTTSNIDAISSMTVWNGQMYVGTEEAGAAEVYRYNGNSAWTKISSSTAGAIGGNGTTTAINAISAMVVHGSKLYVGTSKPNGAEVYRYNGSGRSPAQSWTKVSNLPSNAGTIGVTLNVDTVTTMFSFQGYLFAGTSEAGTSGAIYRYDGQGTTGTGFLVVGSVGTFSGTAPGGISTITSVGSVRTAAVYGGRVYLGIDDGAGTARVVKWDGSLTAGSNYENVSSTTAGIIAEDIGATTGIDRISSMSIYNDDLYVGTSDSTGIGEVYKMDNGSTWSKVSSSTAGTIDATGASPTGSITGVTSMAVYNDDLWVGTEKASATEVYSFNMIEGRSHDLAFDASSDDADGIQNGFRNKAYIQFQAEEGAYNNNGNINTGKFVFSHGLNTVTGAYDLAEDYPTNDDTLIPGDLVSLDTGRKGFVRKAQGKNDKDVIGIYSVNPALRLSQKEEVIDGARAIPVALAGRVPVTVTLENGPIRIGDYLTSSMEPGKAAKANKPGRVIGRALGTYAGTEGEEASVTVFIGAESISWNDLQDAEVDIAEIADGAESGQNAVIEFVDTINDTVADIAFAVLNRADNLNIIITNKFTAIIASVQDLFAKNISLLPDGTISLPSGENQIAGIGMLSAGATDVFVPNEQIDENTIIYLTPTSEIDSPLYIGKKEKGKGFHVRIKSASEREITFDWFFVKTYRPKGNAAHEVITTVEGSNATQTATTTVTSVSTDTASVTSEGEGEISEDSPDSVSSAPSDESDETVDEDSVQTSEGEAATSDSDSDETAGGQPAESDDAVPVPPVPVSEPGPEAVQEQPPASDTASTPAPTE